MTTAQDECTEVAIGRYADIRDEIRTGDLLLCSGASVMSRLIQRATASPWSHVAFIVRIEAIDRLLVLESVESIGVKAVPLSHYVGDYMGSARGYPGRLLIARHDAFASVSPPRLREMLQFACDLLGRRYDTAEIVRIATRIVEHRARLDQLLDHDRTNGLPHDAAYICSEFVWECFRAAGIDIGHDRRGFVAPADFIKSPGVHPLWQIATE